MPEHCDGLHRPDDLAVAEHGRRRQLRQVAGDTDGLQGPHEHRRAGATGTVADLHRDGRRVRGCGYEDALSFPAERLSAPDGRHESPAGFGGRE